MERKESGRPFTEGVIIRISMKSTPTGSWPYGRRTGSPSWRGFSGGLAAMIPDGDGYPSGSEFIQTQHPVFNLEMARR